MEKKTFDLCSKVLERFEKAGLLEEMVLVGSWCVYFYGYFFKSPEYSTFIRTRDIDFVVPLPSVGNKKIDIFKLVEDLGFIEHFVGAQGYMKLAHPDLTVEFLVPERGRGHEGPYDLPRFGINAQPLRFLDFLIDNSVPIKMQGFNIRVPRPEAYVLHKFIIFKRRTKKDKHDRDIEGALRVFHEIIREGQRREITFLFRKMHKSWQAKIISNLRTIGEEEVVDILSSGRKGDK